MKLHEPIYEVWDVSPGSPAVRHEKAPQDLKEAQRYVMQATSLFPESVFEIRLSTVVELWQDGRVVEETLCPRCSRNYLTKMTKALSRKDNETFICERCGVEEVLEDAHLKGEYRGPTYWKVALGAEKAA